MIFGAKIRRLRKTQHWTQRELAAKIGVSRLTVLGWENNSYVPSGRNAEKLAKALDVSIAYLTGETPDPAPPLPRRPPSVVVCELRGTHIPENREDLAQTSHEWMSLGTRSLAWIPIISPNVRIETGRGRECPEMEWEQIDSFPVFWETTPSLCDDGELLSLYVENNSMEPEIRKRDLVVFGKERKWNSGDVMVVCLYGRLHVKGVVRGHKGETILRSLNANFPDAEIPKDASCVVYGKALRVIRQWEPKPMPGRI